MSYAIENNDELLMFVKNTILKYCPIVKGRLNLLDTATTNPELDIWIKHIEDKTVIIFLLGTKDSKARIEEKKVIEHNIEFEDVKGIMNFILQDHGVIYVVTNDEKELEFTFGINWIEENYKGINCGNIGLRIYFNSTEQKDKFYSSFKTYCTKFDNKNIVIDSRLLSEIRREFLESCNKEQMLFMFGIMTVEHLVRIIKQDLLEKCSKEEILAVLSKMDEAKLREYLSNIDYKSLLGFINSRGAIIPKRKEIEQRGDHKYSVFYDENSNEVMSIGFPGSDCWWFFKSATPVVITKDMELYDLLINFMSQSYGIPKEQAFVAKKTEDTLIWYSDCYCEPDNPNSVESVGRLAVNVFEDVIILQCFNDLFDKRGLINQMRGVGFGCCGNGARLARNKNTGMQLGDDFIQLINNPLLMPIPASKLEKNPRRNKNKGKEEKKEEKK